MKAFATSSATAPEAPVTDRKLEKSVLEARTPLTKPEALTSKSSLATSTTGAQPVVGAAVAAVGDTVVGAVGA